MQFLHPKYGAPSKSSPYYDAEGRVIGYMCRWDFENADGEADKLVLPIVYCSLGNGQKGWRSAGFPAPRPLYNLPEILRRPLATVLVVEGEKPADAAATMFPEMVVTTSAHGAKSPAESDWSPLRERSAVICPDNDAIGLEYVNEVAGLVGKAGAASVRVAQVPADFPPKWDLADPMPDGWTTQRWQKLMDAAPIVETDSDLVNTAETESKAGVPYPFELTDTAVLCKDDETEERCFVCSYLEVAAVTRNADGLDWGCVIRLRDRDGIVKEWAMPMELLAGGGEEYRRVLLGMGLVIAPGQKARNRLHQYLSTCLPSARVRCVARIGWHGKVFVLPGETFGDLNGERVLLQTVAPLEHSYRRRGTLKGWQDHVATYAAGNSRLMFSVSAAFAAPLLHLVDAESGGFHVRGRSSTGKTTALEVAGSVWGGGGIKGYTRQWRATDNGLEAVAQNHSDTLLCLDELSQIDGRAAGASAYMLANGAGKSRAGRTGEARSPAEWRVLFLSTGEIGIADKVAEDGRGRKITAGQQVRVIDIPADARAGLGLFENLHGFENADSFSQHLRQAASEHYGTASRAFVAEVAAEIDEVRRAVVGFIDEFIKQYCPPGADGQVSRVVRRFALVAAAGELATAFGIVPWESGNAIEAVGTCFGSWLEARGGIEPAEVTAGIAQVRLFIEMHGESRFTQWGTSVRLKIE